MARVAFITGVNGQDGAYLAQLLLAKDYEVHGGVRRRGVFSTGRLEELNIARDVRLHDFDLAEYSNIRRVLERIRPDEVYNLAAQSFVATSFEQPIYTASIDALGPMRMLEALRELGFEGRFYQASTSEMFGKVQAVPQDETTPFYPRSPYGAAKLFAHWTTVNYRESFNLFACSGILFNHESPLRGTEFVTRKITLGLARLKHGLAGALELGNLEARRDWGYAGDYVEGMWRMVQADAAADYVLATGRTHSVREFVDAAANALSLPLAWSGSGASETAVIAADGREAVSVSASHFRPAEVDLLLGSPLRAEKELGWSRSTDFESLVQLMAEADERRVVENRFRF